MGEDVRSLNYHLKSLKVSERLNNKLRIATSLINIGAVYDRKKATHDKALRYYLRALPLSEEINNHIFRKGHKVLGLSAALIGSGKAVKYDFFEEIMSKITAIGGFDKQMEVLIISQKVTIDYAHEILVFDEKVQLPEVFQNQRKRWMSAQLTFMRKYAFSGIFTSIKTHSE